LLEERNEGIDVEKRLFMENLLDVDEAVDDELLLAVPSELLVVVACLEANLE
jgi:hypothetical protein